MSTQNKKLRPGEARFEVKERKQGRSTTYLVYDRQRGSYPVISTELGKVKHSHTTPESAQTEVDRLNKEHPVT